MFSIVKVLVTTPPFIGIRPQSWLVEASLIEAEVVFCWTAADNEASCLVISQPAPTAKPSETKILMISNLFDIYSPYKFKYLVGLSLNFFKQPLAQK